MPAPSRFDQVFKAYDVRGVVPDQLDEEMTAAVGAAFAAFVRERAGARRVVMGRDMRESGTALSRAFAAGVTSEGLGVVDAGMISTDLLYFASGKLDLPGAMLTASHNPARYNGIKLCLPGARPIGQETGLADISRGAEARLASGSPGSLEPDAALVEEADLLEDFARHVHSFVDVASLRPLKVVADTANGMGGLVAPKVLGSLPFELEILYGDLDGNFPNHPADPIQAENLVDLQRRILETGADVGLAFDGDADRVFLVDEKTVPLSGSLTTAIVAAAMLDAHPGETVLYNLICSKAVPEVIEEHGGVGLRTRVGHSFIKAVMAETGAVFGGEHSGHYYFRDNYRADSGIIAALVVLSVMSKAGVPLSELRRPFERYADSGEINTEVGDLAAVISGVAEAYEARGATLDRLDGLTIDLGAWWFNLRPSNTEPLLRLNLEAENDEACRRHVAEVVSLVKELDDRFGGHTKEGHDGP
ncbi:MAG TPA: phosphomannomutase/phosphoglucomutase [Acidimicrobiales bacterium]|nr:phosphomannomutase/phosphoglucomutase [Acidimicrobiales bacterium]